MSENTSTPSTAPVVHVRTGSSVGRFLFLVLWAGSCGGIIYFATHGIGRVDAYVEERREAFRCQLEVERDEMRVALSSQRDAWRTAIDGEREELRRQLDLERAELREQLEAERAELRRQMDAFRRDVREQLGMDRDLRQALRDRGILPE